MLKCLIENNFAFLIFGDIGLLTIKYKRGRYERTPTGISVIL